ncbi:MAG: MMPL family transporter [Pseudonocardiales bacterium]
MFASFGTAVVKLRWLILVLSVGFLAFAGVWGTGVFGVMSGSSSLDDPASESQRINQRVADQLGRQSVDLVGLYSSDTLSVEQPQFRSAVEAVATKVRGLPDVAAVQTYYDSHSASMISKSGHETFLTVRLAAGAGDDGAKHVMHNLRATGLKSQAGGQKAVDLAINDTVPKDIGIAESVATPLLLIGLLIVFGNFVAASMPLLISAFSVLGAFTLLRVITIFTPVSIFSLSIITILGMGLAVDYGLFIVSRYREELDNGLPVPAAISRTMATAGRTVAISGLLLTLALASLTIFPQTLLRSMGFGGSAAVLFAMLSSLTVLPAMLAVLGYRIDAGRLPWGRRRSAPSETPAAAPAVDDTSGRWARIASSVMRRPVLYALGVVLILGGLALPFAKVKFGGIDERMLPAGTQSRVVSERLAADFPNGGIRPIRVLISKAEPAAATSFQHEIAAISGVNDTAVAAQKGNSTLLSVFYSGSANSQSARGIVTHIRDLARPLGTDVMVGGTSASVVDQLSSLSSRLPLMALLVAGITFLVLAVGFGSLVVPLKAIVMNLVSIGAAFGVVTWVFQDGHLSGLLGFTPTGYVEASQPILMVAILFGLSMDYEVFLLSRVRERWDDLGDNTAAVVTGVQRTGKMITTAAILLCIVLGFFVTSSLTFIKMIGVGTVVALLVDATLVRLVLVPATMRLLGKYNWWAPSFVHKLYGRYGIRESDPVPPSRENGDAQLVLR